jgi:predicted acyl esterase
MKTVRILLLAVFALLCIGQLSEAQHRRARDNYEYLKLLPKYNNFDGLDSVTRYDFKVPLRDGISLDGLKFIPTGTPPAGGWPTVIFVHGYGDNKETLAGFAKSQAQFGYYTATFSMRGQGFSGGLSNLISETEAMDMIEFVNFIKRDSLNGSNPNNILIMGGSQGGLIPYHACTMGMNVKTIISALAPPNFASNWIENGSIKMTFLWTVEYPSDTARYTPQVERMSDWVYANNKKSWDSLAALLPVNRDFMKGVSNNKVPLIMEGSWQDKFFNASGIITASQKNTGSFFKLYLGAVQGHGGDHSPTEDQWHMQFFNDWFFYWIFGQDNGLLGRARYDFAYSTYPVNGPYWSFTHDSSKVPLTQLTSSYKLYFNTSSRLTTTPNSSNSTRSSIRNQVSGGLTLQEAVNEEFTGTVFNSKFKKNTLTYTSTVLTSDVKWLGTPKINLDYLSTAAPFVQYNFQIYEVKSDGTQKLVNRVNYTDRNYTSNSRRVKNFEGQAHAHTFKAGDRIRIVVTNLDTSPDDVSFLGTNPFVLPAINNGYNYLYLSNKSYIDLPIVNASSVFSDAMENGNENPYSFSLGQNYPNPFNPVTNINFELPVKNLVTIKIYDILGRELAALVNEVKDAGSYNTVFDASGFSSGVYFYTIKSGSFTDTKKMLLVK